MLLRYDKSIDDKFAKYNTVDEIFTEELSDSNELKAIEVSFL